MGGRIEPVGGPSTAAVREMIPDDRPALRKWPFFVGSSRGRDHDWHKLAIRHWGLIGPAVTFPWAGAQACADRWDQVSQVGGVRSGEVTSGDVRSGQVAAAADRAGQQDHGHEPFDDDAQRQADPGAQGGGGQSGREHAGPGPRPRRCAHSPPPRANSPLCRAQTPPLPRGTRSACGPAYPAPSRNGPYGRTPNEPPPRWRSWPNLFLPGIFT
jgi:hypothetical protein